MNLEYEQSNGHKRVILGKFVAFGVKKEKKLTINVFYI